MMIDHYYSLLGLPTSFTLDLSALEQAYFAAQRKYHPDRSIGKPEAERVEAFLLSQRINEAYEALKNPLTRAEHLLELAGHAIHTQEQRAVPPAILMEMMELRERLDDAASNGAALAPLVEEIRRAATDCQATLATAFAAADYVSAAHETTRLSYLGKAMEQAHHAIYTLKAHHP